MSTPSVTFPDGLTGSTLLHQALDAACAVDPSLPKPGEPRAFRKRLADTLGAFEAHRAASPRRVEAAQILADHVLQHTRIGEQPVAEALEGAEPSEVVLVDGSRSPGWTPQIDYRGRTWVGAEMAELADRLRADHQLTEAAAEALRWVAREMLHEPVVLRGHRFALLGAGAELAPTPYLLEAGARVLWVDRRLPDLDPSGFAGTLGYAPDALDLLEQAPRIGAQLCKAADDGPLHLGLFAYAPGKGRELRLTAAMNALADHVGEAVASVSMWVSPTTPGEVPAADRADRARRRREAARWQRALCRARVLPEPAFHEVGDTQISRSIVSLQGPTYLAAQYLTKMMAAEAWASRGSHRVSANVAGITHTASLEHPLFLAGFQGAPTFGVEIFQPDQTRVLATLLMLHDLFRPDAPSAAADTPLDRARAVGSKSIHGGVRSLPFVFDPTIRVAAVLGLGQKPSLLKALASSR